MDEHQRLARYLRENPEIVGKVVDLDLGADKLLTFNFTADNSELSPDTVADTASFSAYIRQKMQDAHARYGIGGYMEHRTLYARSSHFDTAEEPRRLHLGVDIWAGAGTPVYAPLAGSIHSFQNNDHFGDYGPTIILQHHLDGLVLYSLYGHLNRAALNGLYEGMPITKDQQIGVFGEAGENGSWPPHLHFQLMFDMQGWKGDYPGVGKFSEKEQLMANIPDPGLVLGF